MPIELNEPLSMLQRIAEVLEYQSILNQAADEPDPLRRLALVSVFTASPYSSLVKRTLKPFNPILGETYELVTKDFMYVAEQVSHHPPVSAAYCVSPKYELWSSVHAESKFTGKSMVFTSGGLLHMKLKRTGEHFTADRPKTLINNIIIGSLYVDLEGDTTITN